MRGTMLALEPDDRWERPQCDKCGGFLPYLNGANIPHQKHPCKKCGHTNLTMRQWMGLDKEKNDE